MKEYSELSNGNYQKGGMTIPADAGNRHYKNMVNEIKSGEAVIVHYEQSLLEAKLRKKSDIQKEKKRIRDGGMDVGGILFDTDGMARISYIEFADRIAVDSEYAIPAWRASDGVFVIMNRGLYDQVKSSLNQLQSNVFSWQEQQEALVNNAESVSEVEAVSSSYSESS